MGKKHLSVLMLYTRSSIFRNCDTPRFFQRSIYWWNHFFSCLFVPYERWRLYIAPSAHFRTHRFPVARLILLFLLCNTMDG